MAEKLAAVAAGKGILHSDDLTQISRFVCHSTSSFSSSFSFSVSCSIKGAQTPYIFPTFESNLRPSSMCKRKNKKSKHGGGADRPAGNSQLLHGVGEVASAFISFSKADMAWVRESLHEALLAQSRVIWADWEDQPPSAEWTEFVHDGIEQHVRSRASRVLRVVAYYIFLTCSKYVFFLSSDRKPHRTCSFS